MFTYQHLKKILSYTLVMLFATMAVTGCGDKPKADDNETNMGLNDPAEEVTKERDERFLVRAAEFDYEQILLGKLARQRATSADVKDFAGMMEESHRNAKSALGSLGIIKSIAVPSSPTQAAHDAYDRLNAVSIEEFDLAYLARVIESHDAAIDLFEGCTQANHDPEVKALAATRLTDLRLHMAKAIELETTLGPLSEVIR
jgi:putative membrane protein